jgi:hypothetical protein
VVSASQEYVQRLRDREARIAQYEKLHVRLGNIRLALFFLAIVIVWISLKQNALSLWWLALPLAAFACVAAYHTRVLEARELARRAAAFYKTGLERIEDRWTGTGETGERFNDPHHEYAADLDLFGKGSLFDLLSTARTRMGEETLAKWLLAPAMVESIRERHTAIFELRDQLDLRERLAILGKNASAGVHANRLFEWAEAPDRMKPAWIGSLAPLLVVLAVLAGIGLFYWGMVIPAFAIIVIQTSLKRSLRKPLQEILQETEHTFRDLNLFEAVLARIEAHTFQTPRLQALQQQLLSGRIMSSRAIARLGFLVELINMSSNPVMRLLDIPVMYTVQIGFAVERWRRGHGKALRSWLATIGEMEALISLAAYSYEHPSDPFPEFIAGAAFFDGEELGHPLVAAAICVRNNVRISGKTRILLVSGSNMSGKSTLMRAVGLNIVLAMAGAPVRARRMQLTPLQVGASIRVNDSLQEGSSRFYAEITRLRKIFDLAGGDPPLLYLLDELLQGTNSRDRRIGAEGIIRSLVNRGAIGLISTHDLVLTDIGDSSNGPLHNVHFQDELENGRMKFDYKLREGVVTKSNGLELMRAIGLDI